MKKSLSLTALFLLFLPAFVWATTTKNPEIPMKVSLQQSQEPLTQEKIWELAPQERNAHLKTWIVTKTLDWRGLDTVKDSDGRWSPKVQTLEAIGTSYVRGPGPWFRPLTDFSCSAEPNEDFQTLEGARVAAEAASAAWSDTLSAERDKLSLLLGRISAQDPISAMAQARFVLNVWASSVDSEWRAQGIRKARADEWRSYLSLAKTAGICPRSKGNPAPVASSREARMEQPAVGAAAKNVLLARAPARRWDGLYTIRMTIEVSRRTLVGQFLVDSGAGVSILSPYWLESQGIPSTFVEVYGAKPQRVVWAGGAGFAKRARVDSASISGLPLSQKEFLLLDTELFGPPNEVSSCCDGIIGTDILREHVVEFEAGIPSAVNFWKREGFSLPGWVWAEVSESSQGDAYSSCSLNGGAKASLQGVRWDTGSVAGVEIHTPWKKTTQGAKEWSLSCAGASIISKLREGGVSLEAIGSGESGPLSVKVPAATIGVPVLSRGRFALDLPHGRIWFDPKGLANQIPRNQSGLTVEFGFEKGERQLRVREIRAGSPSARLIRQGLKAGSLITRVGDRDAAELDLWEVERHLAGVYGSDVVLAWKTGKDMRMATLATR
jgi:hypothetical protein